MLRNENVIVNIIEILVVIFILSTIVIRAIIKRVFLLVERNLTIAVRGLCSNNVHPRSISIASSFFTESSHLYLSHVELCYLEQMQAP